MLPRSLRSEAVHAAKQELYCSGGTTSHWASHADVHPLNACGALPGRLVARRGQRGGTGGAGRGAIPPERLALL